jgi:hypothetical protein
MAYERITRGTKNAPYGYRNDGKPKRKPGRKTDRQRAQATAKKRSK